MALNFERKMKTDRILSIDIIRGFSILGIFLVNMMSFHSPLLYIDPIKWWEGPIDRITYILIDIFAQASFYPLFSIVFGYSMVLLLEKAKKSDTAFIPVAIRRLLSLLLMGMIHAFFVWHGDILIQYAVLGLIFLPFLRLSGKSLLMTGISFYGIPALFLVILLFLTSIMTPGEEVSMFDQEAITQSVVAYQKGTFMEVTKQRVIDWTATNNFENIPFLLISIFPLFFIGAGIAKLKWLTQLERYQKRLSLVVIITLALGLSLKILPYMVNGALYAQYLQDSIGGLCLAVFYGALIIKISQVKSLRKWLSPLTLIGKMSISNYLFQSLLSSLIYYHYGLGLYGKVSLFSGTLLVFLIFSLQIVLSYIWLKYFTYGPVEWFWRLVTYLKPVKLKKSKTS